VIEIMELTCGNPLRLDMSVWHTLEHSILTRTSVAFGGSTCISSTVTGFPSPQHTAATIQYCKPTNINIHMTQYDYKLM